MSVQIWLAIIAIIAAPASAFLTSILVRRRYDAEIEKLRAEVDQAKASARSSELDNVREGNDILMKQIVEPLKAEIKSLRTDLNKLRRAIEKIPACPHSAECPVSLELLADEKGNDDRQPNQ